VIVTVAMILETAGAVAVVKLAMIQETVKEPMPGMLKTENFKDIAEGVASVLVQETADVVVVFTVVMQTSEDKNGVARLQTNAYTEKKAFLPNQLMFLDRVAMQASEDKNGDARLQTNTFMKKKAFHHVEVRD